MYVCVRARVRACVRVCMYVSCMHASMYVSMDACMYVSMYVSIYVLIIRTGSRGLVRAQVSIDDTQIKTFWEAKLDRSSCRAIIINKILIITLFLCLLSH